MRIFVPSLTTSTFNGSESLVSHLELFAQMGRYKGLILSDGMTLNFLSALSLLLKV